MVRRVYNKVYDPEIWEKVNPQNKELLDDFMMDLRENKRSPITISQYFSDLRGFFCYLYRAYNNRFAQNDSNHRYATDVAVYNSMVTMGWSGEGVVMCAPV